MRSQPLDILRAVAVFLVLGNHLLPCPPEVNRVVNSVTAVWRCGGWVGVDLFFVLSGFLISGLLFKEQIRTGSISVGRFLLRRGFKIYPAFYLMIFATVVFARYRVNVPTLLAEVFFVQNYFTGVYIHTWSLAVEEHFYLLLSLGIGYLPFLRRSIPLAFAIIAVTCLALRIYTAQHYPFSGPRNIYPTHLRFDSLGFGVLLAYFKYYRPQIFVKLQRSWLLVPGILALTPVFIFQLKDTPFLYTTGLTLNYLGCGMILLGAIGAKPFTGFIGRLVANLGSRSYSIYLWHWWVMLEAQHISNWYLYASVYLVGAIVVGTVMNLLVETPILKLRDFFFPPAQSVPAPAEVVP